LKFTVRGIEALKPKTKRYDMLEPEGHGFGVRVAPSGRKSWIYLYHYGGRLRRMTLGTYPNMTLADAHKALQQHVRQSSRAKIQQLNMFRPGMKHYTHQ
jgi:hypothetical protein